MYSSSLFALFLSGCSSELIDSGSTAEATLSGVDSGTVEDSGLVDENAQRILSEADALAVAYEAGVQEERVVYVDLVPYDGDRDDDFVLVWGVTEGLSNGSLWETYIDPYDGGVLAQEAPHPGLQARIEDLQRGSGTLGATVDTYESFPWGWQLPFESSTGYMTNGYGRGYHTGSDTYATDWDPGACGHTVYAPASGWVMSNSSVTGYGNQLIVAGKCRAASCRTGGWDSRYLFRLAHLEETSTVTPGWWIAKGTDIGDMGNTGYSTACHIHFSVYQGSYSGGSISGSSVPINRWPSSSDSICDGALASKSFSDSTMDTVTTGSGGCP